MYSPRPDNPALAEKGALIASDLQRAMPLRAEAAAPFGAALTAFAEAAGVTVEDLTIGQIFDMAGSPPQPEPKLFWYALGKIGGAWYAIAPANGLESLPLVPVIVGHRRRLLQPQDLARARAFATKKEARDAGWQVFPRTHVFTFK
jgi:hypothetical protein